MKSKITLLLIIILFGNHLLAQGNNIEIPELRKNSVYLEFGDMPYMLNYSLNYDRAFALGERKLNSLGLRTGFMVTRWHKHDNDFSIPIEAFYLLGKRICFELGFTYVYFFGSPDYYAFGMRAGLRWRDATGIMIRVALTPTIANDGIEVYTIRTYGISMGYSF